MININWLYIIIILIHLELELHSQVWDVPWSSYVEMGTTWGIVWKKSQ